MDDTKKKLLYTIHENQDEDLSKSNINLKYSNLFSTHLTTRNKQVNLTDKHKYEDDEED